jgi:hypothetical protein
LQHPDEHVLVRCINTSEARVEAVEVHVTRVDFLPDGKSDARRPKFTGPIPISPFSDYEMDAINLQPHGNQYFSVLVRQTDHDPPRFNSRRLPIRYEYLFDEPGRYNLTIEAYGRDTPPATAVIALQIKTEIAPNPTGRTYPRYDIVYVGPQSEH